MGREALRIGADTFAFFTRNPRGGNVKPMDVEDAAELHQLLKRENFAPLVAHAPYTYNLCSDKPRNREFAKEIRLLRAAAQQVPETENHS